MRAHTYTHTRHRRDQQDDGVCVVTAASHVLMGGAEIWMDFLEGWHLYVPVSGPWGLETVLKHWMDGTNHCRSLLRDYLSCQRVVTLGWGCFSRPNMISCPSSRPCPYFSRSGERTHGHSIIFLPPIGTGCCLGDNIKTFILERYWSALVGCNLKKGCVWIIILFTKLD